MSPTLALAASVLAEDLATLAEALAVEEGAPDAPECPTDAGDRPAANGG